jgi:hypothetical protein
MMTTELPEFSPRKSETKNTERRTPTLDLFNVLTLAEDIAAEPDGPQARRFAKQIVEHCELEDVDDVREMAEAIRQSSDASDRARLADQIIEKVGAILRERDAEAVQVETAPIPAAV